MKSVYSKQPYWILNQDPHEQINYWEWAVTDSRRRTIKRRGGKSWSEVSLGCCP